MKISLLTILFVLCAFVSNSQVFSAHPPGLQWTKLESKEVNILYPKNIEPQAISVYHRINQFYHSDTTLGTNRFKLNLVLQNQTVRSNGYVGVGPFMSEFFLTPPFDSYVLGSVDWTEALSIHEYRHALQAMNSRQGISKQLYYVMGEEAWAAAYGLAVPDWFSEGDAVFAETKHTIGGRGRMPSFNMQFRALYNEQIQWPYIKSRNGSFKDIVPNEYVSGYNMVNYVNQHFAPNTWGKILEDAVRYKGLFSTFGKGLKRHTGLTPTKLYELAIKKFDIRQSTNNISSRHQHQRIINDLAPNRMPDGSFIYLETGFDVLPRLIKKNKDGDSKILSEVGITVDEDFGFSDHLLTWTELTIDPRWEQRTYSDVFAYDMRTGEKKKLSFHQKYFNPNPSNDGTRIVCAEYLTDGNSRLVILENAGRILKKIEVPKGQIATFPAFDTGDSTFITAIRSFGFAQLVRYSITTGIAKNLTQPVAGIISNLSANNDTVYFSSDVSGRDNLFAYDPASNKIYQLTDDSIGIQQFGIYGNEILYNIQTAHGIKIRSLKLDSIVFKPVEYFNQSTTNFIPAKSDINSSNGVEIKAASLWSNPFRVYSWALRPDEGGNVLRVLGRNVLNTLQTTLAYHFLQDEGSQSITGGLALGIGYPVLNLAGGYTWNRRISKLSNPLQDSIYWNETSYRIGVSVPWKFYRQNHIFQIQPGFQWGQYLPNYKTGDRSNYQATHYVRSSLQFLSYRRRALQHVSPRFMQQINLSYNYAVNNAATSFEVNSEWHVPGLLRNHVIELNADYRHQLRSDPYRFPTINQFISGYESFISDYAYRWKIAYHFPLLYPDAGINGLFYVKRIRTRLFYEKMNSTIVRTRDKFQVPYASSGADLLFDGTTLNVLPISFGFRFSYLLDRDLIRNSKTPRIEFLVEQLF